MTFEPNWLAAARDALGPDVVPTVAARRSRWVVPSAFVAGLCLGAVTVIVWGFG